MKDEKNFHPSSLIPKLIAFSGLRDQTSLIRHFCLVASLIMASTLQLKSAFFGLIGSGFPAVGADERQMGAAVEKCAETGFSF